MNWQSVEAFIARSRITAPMERLVRQVDRSEAPPGAARMDAVRGRFGWSDHDLADALGVDWSQASPYRVYGVPDGMSESLAGCLASLSRMWLLLGGVCRGSGAGRRGSPAAVVTTGGVRRLSLPRRPNGYTPTGAPKPQRTSRPPGRDPRRLGPPVAGGRWRPTQR